MHADEPALGDTDVKQDAVRKGRGNGTRSVEDDATMILPQLAAESAQPLADASPGTTKDDECFAQRGATPSNGD